MSRRKRNLFPVILADPSWDFKTWSDRGKDRSAENHYKVSKLDIIKAYKVPAADDCVLFLWCVYPLLPEALEVIKAWGFTYKTRAFTYVKLNKNGKPFTGMGYWTRANSEICLLATKGHPKRINKDVHELIQAPRREHSRKPDEQYERIERLVKGPYIELFARDWGQLGRKHWTFEGFELEKRIRMAWSR